ncbi:hypothetical protein ACET3X_001811 [Alternaria dauci]|uniref:Uncharacterized protein n=1 Tax=Alternaria dauci TaxID=48095 RepID=A0ABR3V098_9PLEO
MSENEPLQPRVKSLLDKEISTIWFTASLPKLSHSEREKYVSMLRTKLQESLKKREALSKQADCVIAAVDAPVATLRQQDEPDQLGLEHAEKVSEEAKREVMIDRLVHDAMHEGLEALLRKVEDSIWGQAA